MNAIRPILVVTLGNTDRGDDAVGALVAAILRRRLPRWAELADLAIAPSRLLDLLDGRTALLIVDALCSADVADGQVVDVDWRQHRGTFELGPTGSTHGLGVVDQLELAERLGMLPLTVRLVGIGSVEQAHGAPPRPPVVDAAARAAEHVIVWCHCLADEDGSASGPHFTASERKE